ncbi:hypothetical protein, partial [Pseudovibrio axinellae]|uniref:hypothetical protein n=1 Tax=Pseudovibrio axinellae TaxID=989403 RepID=UPI001AD8D2BC
MKIEYHPKGQKRSLEHFKLRLRPVFLDASTVAHVSDLELPDVTIPAIRTNLEQPQPERDFNLRSISLTLSLWGGKRKF